eukprot:gene17429-23731_t
MSAEQSRAGAKRQRAPAWDDFDDGGDTLLSEIRGSKSCVLLYSNISSQADRLSRERTFAICSRLCKIGAARERDQERQWNKRKDRQIWSPGTDPRMERQVWSPDTDPRLLSQEEATLHRQEDDARRRVLSLVLQQLEGHMHDLDQYEAAQLAFAMGIHCREGGSVSSPGSAASASGTSSAGSQGSESGTSRQGSASSESGTSNPGSGSGTSSAGSAYSAEQLSSKGSTAEADRSYVRSAGPRYAETSMAETLDSEPRIAAESRSELGGPEDTTSMVGPGSAESAKSPVQEDASASRKMENAEGVAVSRAEASAANVVKGGSSRRYTIDEESSDGKENAQSVAASKAESSIANTAEAGTSGTEARGDAASTAVRSRGRGCASDPSGTDGDTTPQASTSGRGAGWDPNQAQALSDILNLSTNQLSDMNSDCLAKLLWGLAMGGLRPKHVWLREAEDAVLGVSWSMTAKHVVWVLEAFVRFGYKVNGSVLMEISVQAQSRLDHLTPSKQAALLKSLYLMGYVPSVAFLTQYIQCSRSKLSGLPPADYANIIALLANLRYLPPRWWLDSFTQHSYRKMMMFDASAAAAMFYSLTTMQVDLPRCWVHDCITHLRNSLHVESQGSSPSLFTESTGCVHVTGYGALAGGLDAASLVKERHLRWARSQVPILMDTLICESIKGQLPPAWRGPPGQLTAGGTSITSSSQEFQPLVDLLYICAELTVRVPGSRVARFLPILIRALPSFSPNHCSIVLVSMAVIQAKPTQVWLEQFFVRVLQLLNYFPPSDMANVLNAAGDALLDALTQKLPKYSISEIALFVRKMEQAEGRGATYGEEAPWLAAFKSTLKRIFAASV